MTALAAWWHTHPKVRRFLAATGERVYRSFGASLIGSLTVGNVVLPSVDLAQALSVAGSAAGATLLFCLFGQAVTGNGPSFSNTETTTKED